MLDEDLSTLTPDEAGAFVAQWAERRKVDVSELAERLGVDEAQTTSLLRQARGRLHMEVWLREKQPRSAGWVNLWAPIAAALVIGGIAGCLVMNHFMPTTEPADAQAHPLPPPPIQISTSMNSSGTDQGPVPPGAQTPLSPHAIAMRQLKDPNSHASMGERLRMLDPAGSGSGGVQDLSEKLATKIPADLVVEVGSSSWRYVIHGAQTDNYESALELREQDIEGPVHDLVEAIVAHRATNDGGVNSTEGGEPRARILVRIGSAASSALIPWNSRDIRQLKQFEQSDSPVYRDLSLELLHVVHHLGPQLFKPSMHPFPRSR